MSVKRKVVPPAVWLIYLVIVLEFLFMISPVALHFYSSYAPVLNIFHGSRATAWLTGFFLPHFSESTSWALNQAKPLGFQLGYVGLFLFLVGAAQVYTAKIFRRGAVTRGLYRWVRHPQYLGLAILGLGVTLIWSRFLVLISYVTMLFLYVLLARWEENLCLAKYGESYRSLQERTGMILPRAVEKYFHSKAPVENRRQTGRLVAFYFGALAVSLTAAFLLREFSLNHVTSYFDGRTAVLSPALLSKQELVQAYRLASSDAVLSETLREDADRSSLLVYVVPESWFMPDLPLHSEEEIRSVGGGHLSPDTFDRDRFKLLFTRVRSHADDATGKSIIRSGYALDPVLIVRVDLESDVILSREVPPTTVIWGDIPTPFF